MIFDLNFQNFLLYYKVFQPPHYIYLFFSHLVILFYHNFFFISFQFFSLYHLILSIFILFFLIVLIYNLWFVPEVVLVHLSLQQSILFFLILFLIHFSLLQISLFLFFIFPFRHSLHHIELFDLFELINPWEILIFVHFHQHSSFLSSELNNFQLILIFDFLSHFFIAKLECYDHLYFETFDFLY